MKQEIYQDMIQPKGAAYRSDQIKPWSHYREPIDTANGRLAGNSRVWGDASPEVQSAVVDKIIESCERKGLSTRDTAYVLAIARVESGFNPDACAGTTSAAGLGQFIDKTGKHYGVNNANRWDVDKQADALVMHYLDNKRLAVARGHGDEYIYKYHHDGPSKDYGGLGISEKRVMPYAKQYEGFVKAHSHKHAQGHDQFGQAPAPSRIPDRAGSTKGQKAILDEAKAQFDGGHGQYEYGRPDMRLKNDRSGGLTDPSRDGRDLDHDGKKGVDCSSLVWKSLKNAGYDVPKEPFTTAALFSRGEVTSYAKKHFDVISGADAAKTNGKLQVGDLLMFEGKHGRHVAIFSGYDKNGHITFYGSQVSTGPAAVQKNTGPGEYWNGKDFQIIGALRAKPEFQVREPLNGGAPAKAEPARPSHGSSVHHTDTAPSPGQVKSAGGTRDTSDVDLVAAQKQLAALGYRGLNGYQLKGTGVNGENTVHAVKEFQSAHGLKPDGIAGPKTLEALRHAKDHPLINEAGHPSHGMYEQIKAQTDKLGGAKALGFDSGKEYTQALANMTWQARTSGLTRVDHVIETANKQNLVMIQGGLSDPAQQREVANKAHAAQQPVTQSTQQLQQDVQQLQQQHHVQGQQQQQMSQGR